MASVLQPGLSNVWRIAGRPAVPAPAREAFLPRQEKLQPGLPIAITGLSKRYGDRIVLRDVNLTIEPGQFIAIVGRSGSGKSTLLRILAGLDDPESGQVRLGGLSPREAAAGVRIMFQDGRLLPWRRVIDNVGLGLKPQARKRAFAALDAVGLPDRAQDWPSVLSGGQKQRVALARALASDPRLVLLDEPLGALDALTRLDMQALVETVWRQAGFTAVLVTHDVAEAALLADRILLIEEGGIALDISVDLPRPRRAGAAIAAIEAQVLDRILRR
jgi:sulfonate transport system ATP-binding protein